MTRPSRLDEGAVSDWLAGHREWSVHDGHLVREITTTDYGAAVAIVAAQVGLAEALDHHPVVTIGYRTLRFEVWTHDRDGLTRLDFDYADGLEEILRGRFGDVAD